MTDLAAKIYGHIKIWIVDARTPEHLDSCRHAIQSLLIDTHQLKIEDCKELFDMIREKSSPG